MTIQHTVVTMKPLGDSALIVQLGDGIDPSIHEKVRIYQHYWMSNHLKDLSSPYLPTITSPSITIHSCTSFHKSDEEVFTPFQKVSAFMSELVQQIGRKQTFEERTVTIPVLYGGEFGPDLEYVATYHGLSNEEVIRIHSENEYLVYMIGFAPGFPFHGGHERRDCHTAKRNTAVINCPRIGRNCRKTNGRLSIGNSRGWQIIGRTPQDLFLPTYVTTDIITIRG